jgi:putative ABC transport system permease protein
MKLDDLGQVVSENLFAHRLRALLTILGITIGIAAVILVVAIGQGGQAAILSEIEKLGSSRSFNVTVDESQGEAPTNDTFSMEDANLIKELSPAVAKMAPVSYATTDVRLPQTIQKPVLTEMVGTTPDYAFASNLTVNSGRFLSTADVSAHSRVVVLDADLAEQIFGDANPLGSQVFIQDNSATVIGVLQSQDSGLAGSVDLQYAYVPISFAQDILNNQVIDELCGVAVSKDALSQAMADSIKILNKRHFASTVHYKAESLDEQLSAISKLTSAITMVVGSIAAIALVVGGIGVMNIMLVAVTERTREIGLLKALGARRCDIMQQFLGEAVALCLVGGFFGVVIGSSLALVVAYYAKWPPLISGWTILLAFGFSAAVGIFFGVYPASRAAALSPAEALRYL